MATTIITKNGSGAPLAGDLQVGELAIDLTNKKLYSKEGTTVFEVGATGGGAAGTFTDLTATNSFTSVGIDDNATSTAITIDSSQNVGIGTTSPNYQLTIGDGTDALETINIISTDASQSRIFFSDASNNGQGRFTYDHSDDSLRVFTNDTERMRIDSSGNVGIGTNTIANAKLEIASGANQIQVNTGDEATNGRLAIGHFANGTFIGTYAGTNAGANLLRFGTSGTERMRIDSSGNVGIGTDSPSAGAAGGKVLHVQNSGATASVRVDRSDAATAGTLSITSGNTSNGIYSTGAKDLSISTNSTERMRIDSGGVIKLITANDTAGTSKFLTFGTNSFNRAGIKCTNAATYDGSLEFYTGNSVNFAERMRIDSSGNVGINTSSPQATLQVKNTSDNATLSSVSSSLTLNHQSGTYTNNNYYSVLGFAKANSNGTTLGASIAPVMDGTGQTSALTFGIANGGLVVERMRIDSSGNLLVGTTSALTNASRLQVSGTGGASTIGAYRATASATSTIAAFASDVGGTQVNTCLIKADGDLENTNNSYGAISDARLKSNIVDASPQLNDIMAVQVRSYTLDSTGDTHIGVVAQELEASGMSGLVQENEEGMKSVKYSVLYMKAIKALQEAVTRIETLEAEVAALKGE